MTIALQPFHMDGTDDNWFGSLQDDVDPICPG